MSRSEKKTTRPGKVTADEKAKVREAADRNAASVYIKRVYGAAEKDESPPELLELLSECFESGAAMGYALALDAVLVREAADRNAASVYIKRVYGAAEKDESPPELLELLSECFESGAAMGYALALDAVLASIEREHPILACRAIAGYVLALRERPG